MNGTKEAARQRLGYADEMAILDDFLSSHPLPMALLDANLKVLGISTSFAEFLPSTERQVAGLSAEALLARLGNVNDGQSVAPGELSLDETPAAHADLIDAIREGQWRLGHIVTHQGRVVVPFSYPLASGNTQLVLLEPGRMNEVTDLGEVLDVAADAFAIFDENSCLIRCNTQFVELLTYDPTSPPPLGQTAKEIVQQVVEAGTLLVGAGLDQPSMVDAMVTGLLTPTGATFEVEGKLGRIFLASTKPRSSGGHILTLRDITDIRRAERQAISTMRSAVDSLEQGFAYYDEGLNLQVWNEQYDRMYCGDCGLHPKRGEDGVAFLRRVMETGRFVLEPGETAESKIDDILGKVERGERVEYHFSDGTSVLCSYNRTSSNGLLVTLMDITDKRNSEYRTLQTLSAAIEALDQGFAQFDEDRRLVFCNPRYRELLFDPEFPQPEPGMRNAELAHISLASGRFVLPAGLTKDGAVDRLEKWMIAERKNFQLQLTDGKVLNCGYSRTALGGYLVTLHDVTDRLASERRALNTLRDAAGALEEGFALWDEDLNFILSNDRYCELMFKDPTYRLQPGQSAEAAAIVAAQNLQNLREQGIDPLEYARQGMQQIVGLTKGLEMKLDTGKIVQYSGHRTEQGYYLVTVLDVTERHRAAEEIERQAQIAHQNEKLSALGELLAGVAHELNNPLSIVVGYSQLLSGELTDPKQIDRIGRITQAAERSARIVKTFLAMARQKPARMEPVDLADVIESAVDVAAYGLRTSGGRLLVNSAPDLPLVEADTDQMVQVLSNLIVNAEHAMKGMGRDARLSIRAQRQNGCVEVVVADNGAGMDAKTRARIFEPFFTTKDIGSGTGFGLAFCHRIVTSHGGELTVASVQGKGSQFTITLPAIAVRSEEAKGATGSAGIAIRALVVDDEPDVADLIAEILSARGHKVTCAYGPDEAIAAVEGGPFDIVLSDMKMPAMTGDQLQRQLVEKCPELAGHIGFITGDSLSERVRNFLEDGRQQFIEKPVVVEELLNLVELIRPRPARRTK